MKYFLTAALLFSRLFFPEIFSQPHICSAGTFTFGPLIGQSNDVTPDTIFLCQGDSLFIHHNGDQVFMDPDPATPAGIAYAFYSCPPMMSGSDTAVLADPCLWPGGINGFFVSNGPPSGDHWLFNSGAFISTELFCSFHPCLIYFAPVTITDYANGMLEPGCVAAGIDQAFAVVYLRQIQEKSPATGASSVSANFGDDCKGKFRLWGGFPEWDEQETYTVDISLADNPDVKGLLHNAPAHLKHGLDVIFSVPEPGLYKVTVEDGKSCGSAFQVNMNGCDASDNFFLSLPAVIAKAGGEVCLPLRARRSWFMGASFSISWDTSVIQFKDIRKVHPALKDEITLVTNELGSGKLGIAMIEPGFTPDTVPAGEAMLEFCFKVTGPAGTTSPVRIDASVLPLTFDSPLGEQQAFSVHNGFVTVKQSIWEQAPHFPVKISPNPVKGGSPVFLSAELPGPALITVRICDPAGRLISEQTVQADTGMNRISTETTGLPAGYYLVYFGDEEGYVGRPEMLVVGR